MSAPWEKQGGRATTLHAAVHTTTTAARPAMGGSPRRRPRRPAAPSVAGCGGSPLRGQSTRRLPIEKGQTRPEEFSTASISWDFAAVDGSSGVSEVRWKEVKSGPRSYVWAALLLLLLSQPSQRGSAGRNPDGMARGYSYKRLPVLARRAQ